MTHGPITELYHSDSSVPTTLHRHNVHQMLYVTEGCLTLEIAGRTVRCCAPAVLFIGNSEPHMITAAPRRYTRYVLALNPGRMREQIAPEILHSVFTFHPPDFPYALDVSPIDAELRADMNALMAEHTAQNGTLPQGESLLLSALLYRLYRFAPALFTAPSAGTAEIAIDKVRRTLEQDFSAKLDLDALAAEHHFSRHYLSHLFHRHTGCSLREYRMNCRIAYAAHRLEESSDSIRKIAEETGFKDVCNFSRSFRERLGTSPSAYRSRTAHSPTALSV